MGTSISDGRFIRSEMLIGEEALNTLSALSVYSNILDVNEEDQLLLLITCVGDDNQRLVVAARRLRENESPDRLTMRTRSGF